MLKKKERLNRTQFDRSFSIGKRIHTPVLQLIYDQQGTFHGAAVVGKKVYKKAVDRNTLRRRLYAAIYHFHKQYQIDGTFILIAKPKIKELSRAQVRTQAYELLQKVTR